MTYEQLVERVARKCHLTKKGTREVLDGAFLELTAEASRGPVRIPGFGLFEPRSRKARRVRDLATGRQRQLPKLFTVGFRPAGALKAKAAAAERAHQRALARRAA